MRQRADTMTAPQRTDWHLRSTGQYSGFLSMAILSR